MGATRLKALACSSVPGGGSIREPQTNDMATYPCGYRPAKVNAQVSKAASVSVLQPVDVQATSAPNVSKPRSAIQALTGVIDMGSVRHRLRGAVDEVSRALHAAIPVVVLFPARWRPAHPCRSVDYMTPCASNSSMLAVTARARALISACSGLRSPCRASSTNPAPSIAKNMLAAYPGS
jgi:hypothetical protein